MAPSSAQAGSPQAYSGFPFGYGFYQPYGVRYSTSVRTPPYFAVNPPVYYGSRHSRPYGASPFASLPLVEAGAGYRTRPADQFVRPPQGPMMTNPYCAQAEPSKEAPLAQVSPIQESKVAPIKRNPYATDNIAVVTSRTTK